MDAKRWRNEKKVGFLGYYLTGDVHLYWNRGGDRNYYRDACLRGGSVRHSDGFDASHLDTGDYVIVNKLIAGPGFMTGLTLKTEIRLSHE